MQIFHHTCQQPVFMWGTRKYLWNFSFILAACRNSQPFTFFGPGMPSIFVVPNFNVETAQTNLSVLQHCRPVSGTRALQHYVRRCTYPRPRPPALCGTPVEVLVAVFIFLSMLLAANWRTKDVIPFNKISEFEFLLLKIMTLITVWWFAACVWPASNCRDWC